jgi:1-phosphofructokinase
MIVTVTPNPSIDRTLVIPPLVRGGLVRARSVSAEAGGKGINVSRVLAIQACPTVAIAPLSDASEAAFRALLRDTVPLEAIRIRGDARTNVSLVESDGTVTKVNEPGPAISAGEVDRVIDRVAQLGASARWVVASGSLPPGAPADLYARIARSLPPGVRFAVDADGEALRSCLGEPIALIKPNHKELETLAGHDLPTLGDVVAAAEEIVAAGADTVLVSLGPDGAVVVDSMGVLHAEAPIDDARNTVGAGDALLAGYLAAGARRDDLGHAVAWSVAACRSPGTRPRLLEPRDLDAVVVHPATVASRQLAA